MRRRILLMTMLIISYCQVIVAQNTCATATLITSNGTISAPGPSTGGGCYNCGSATDANWYQWTATADGLLDVSACGLTATDTRLWVYSGTCAGLTQVAADDDACTSSDGFASAVTAIPITNGTTYYLEWDNRWSTAAFQFNFTFTAVSCLPPSALGVESNTATTADIYWTSGGASNWDVEYGLIGFSPGSGTIVNATNDSITLTGLTANSVYEFYVRDSCGVGNSSGWVGPIVFGLNNTCATATILTAGGTYWAAGPTAGGGCNNCGTATNANWYQWTAPGNGLLDISACGLSGNDTRLWVYDGSCGSLTQVGADDDACTSADGFASAVIGLAVTNGTTYYLEWDDRWDSDPFQFSIAFTLVSCNAPSALGVSNATATGVDLYWTAGGATDWNVEYGLSGFTPGTGTLTNATNDTVSVSGLTAATAYEFYVRDSCAVGNVSSWVGPFGFKTGFTPPMPLSCTVGNPIVVFTEEFDAVNGWTGDINGGNDTWEIPGAPTSSNTGPDDEHSGPAGSFMNFEASNTSVSSGQVVSPAIDLTTAMGDAELSFWMHAYGANMGRLTVGVGTSATGPFTPVFTWAGQYQTSGSDPWVNIGADLSAYIGQTIYIQFHQLDSVSGFTGDMSIDLVEVSACISCPNPTALGATNITSTGADLYWTTGGASNWNVEYGTTGFTPGTGTMVNAINDTVSIGSLSSLTTYEFYVRDSCAVGDVSGWVGPYTFMTPCAVVLSGTYTINGAQPTGGTNYNTFAEAAYDLNNCGISSAVTFNVQAGLYVDQLHLNGVPGTSVSNTITFNGVGGDTLVWDGNGEQGTVIIENTSHVTLQNMLIANQASSEAWGVLLIDNSDTVTIDNCIIAMDSTSTSTDVSAVLVSNSYINDLTEGADVDGLTINNCLIIGGYYAMNFEGVGSGTYSKDYNVTNTVIRNFYAAGIYVDEIQDFTCVGNTMETSRGTAADGLYTFDINNFVFEENVINVPDYGLYIVDGNDGFTPTSNSRVVNNMITSTGDYGMYLNDFESTEVYHNSVVGEPAIRINDQINLDVRNNIFVSIGDFAFESDDALTATDVLDYNIYFSTGANAFDVGPTVYADLALWQGGDLTKNVNSIEGDPIFYGATDLHLLGTIANNSGDVTVGVLVDIDGDVRSLTTPDIGADEYAPASCVPSSVLMVANVYADSATVYWTPGTGQHYNIEYGTAGFTAGTGTLVTGVVDTFYTITGLTPNTAYDFYLQDSCGLTDVSVWAGPESFITFPVPVTVPYTEDFEGATNDMAISSGSDAFAAVDTFGCASTNAILFTGGSSAGWSGSSSSTGTSVNQAWVVNTTKHSQALLLVDATANTGTLMLEFDLRQEYSYGQGYNWFRVLINDTDQVTPDYHASASTGDVCARMSIDISAYTGTMFSVKFQGANKYAIGTGTANGDNAFLDNVSIYQPAVAGCSPFTSNIPNDTICAPGFTGFTSNTGSSVVYLDTALGQITNAGDTLRIITNSDTTLSLIEAAPTSVTGHVGPLSSIATAGYGNFSNGQWISILDTVRIDSMTVNANGVVEANLRIWTDDPANGGTLVQRGKTFTTGSATGDYQVSVGAVLLPGSYFINVEFTGGTGQLFRATGGASYPYVLAGLMSIDSTNFSSQARIYYTFDLVATKVCLGAPVLATSYIRGLSAGSDQSLILCDNGSAEDLTTYLSQGANLGGTFVSSNASAAISGNMFDPTLLTAGTYQVYYTTVATATCPSDSALFTVEIQACLSCVGLTTPTLTPDTICGSGVVNLMATQSGTDIVWFNPQNRVEGYGTTLSTTINATTQFVAQAILSSGPSITAGPSQSLSVNAYPTANFTNGQYISVAQDVRIDSAVFAVNGPLDFVVAIQDAQRTDTLQVSNLISFTAGDTAAKEIGIYLSPGNYFINTIPISGTGILWRPTAGANFPYGAPNILSVDSSDFGPTRLYYLYDMKVSAACLSAPDSTFGVIVSGTNAGTSDSVSVCGSNTMVDLSSYLGSFDMGGTWYDDDATGAMSTSGMFDASMVSTGVYNFTYALPSASGCPGDSATITVTVASPNTAGMDTTASACTSQTALPLRPLLPGSAPGGSWIDVDNSGALVGNSFFVSGVSVGTYRFTYYTAAGICPADSATVTVVVSAGVSAGTFANDTICNDASPLDLNTLLDATATTGGTWKDVSASGGLSGSLFNPGAVVAGQSYVLRYVVSNACGMDSAEVSLYVEDCTVGLKDYVASNLVMYPNPTSGNLTIEMTGEDMKDMNVQVYGLSGKLLISSEFEDTKKATINLTAMPKGVYTIKVFTNRGMVVRQVTKM
ncbi:T9SS type A sorting domain-containing protein [Owenweeksia hongkongensis]|uniref:T9SS type A sorting domain-containing protein n=1 Tax=Owenweeksia hongkongensis TaxID=253245 RepID=UPI003A8CB6FD